MIRLGTYLVRDEKLTPKERLGIIKSTGFDYVCFNMQQMLAGEAKGLTPELCAKVGIDYDNVHLTGNGTHAVWAEGDEGEMITERYCREIAICREYGIKVGITHVTWGTAEPPPVGPLGLSRFERIVECAEKNGVVLALENSVSETHLRYVLDRVKSPYLGYCFDSGHRNAFAKDADFLRDYGDRLVATHLQDNDGRKDLHLMPLDGCIDWKKASAELAGTAHARRQICAEVAGITCRKRPGVPAETIRARLAHLSAVKEGLVHIEDGSFTAYKSFTYEEMIDRLYRAMQMVARMIEAPSEG